MGWRIAAALLAFAVSLSAARAQSPGRDFRGLETAIELAWMSDPITFPYELRARFTNGVVEVHGKAPTPNVRKQALNIASLFAAKNVLDQIDVDPQSTKDFVNVPGETVVVAANARLARTLPQLTSTVQVKCDADGRVTLLGTASTLAEKMTLSEMMRRVPGCLLVKNQVRVGPAPAVNDIQLVSFETPAVQPPGNGLTDLMTREIARLCPRASAIQVQQLTPIRFRIQFSAVNEIEASQLASIIFNHRDWKSFRLDVDVNVPK